VANAIATGKKGHRGYPGECKRSAEPVMQNLFIAWLALPVVMLFASLFAFYLATAALLVWLSFRSKLSDRIQSFKGLVAPFFVSTATIFGLLVGFLSNDIWERNKQASRVVLAESDTLLALYSLGAASGSDDRGLRTAIRVYVRAVVDDEWPRLAVQERSAQVDAALNTLLREVAQPVATKDAVIQRTMLDMVLRCSRRPRGAEQRSNHGDEVDSRPAARAHYPNRDRRCAPGKAATAIGRASYLYHRRCINPRFARGSRGTIRTAHFRPSRPNWRRLAASPHVIRFIEPMYALASNDLPKGDEWLYEVKLPGHFFRRGNQDLAALAGTPRFRGPGLLGSPLALSVGFLLAVARRREWIAQARIVAYRGTLGRMV